MSKVTLDRETISPKQAREYLESNTHNRHLREPRVQQLMGAIERGEWKETGDPIKFNGDLLLDGQHRLEAIARGSRRVPVWVARGVDAGAQEVVDTGSKRSVGDALTLRGYQNATLLGAIANIVWTYRVTGEPLHTGRHSSATPQQLLQLIEDEPILTERASMAGHIGKADRSLGVPQSLIGAFLHLFAEKTTEEDAAAFFDQLLSPKAQSDATAVLRRRLLQQSAHVAIPVRLKTALIIKAWNAWILGERPKRIGWRPREDFPDIQGHID